MKILFKCITITIVDKHAADNDIQKQIQHHYNKLKFKGTKWPPCGTPE